MQYFPCPFLPSDIVQINGSKVRRTIDTNYRAAASGAAPNLIDDAKGAVQVILNPPLLRDVQIRLAKVIFHLRALKIVRIDIADGGAKIILADDLLSAALLTAASGNAALIPFSLCTPFFPAAIKYHRQSDAPQQRRPQNRPGRQRRNPQRLVIDNADECNGK